jgi:hypothetical protein
VAHAPAETSYQSHTMQDGSQHCKTLARPTLVAAASPVTSVCMSAILSGVKGKVRMRGRRRSGSRCASGSLACTGDSVSPLVRYQLSGGALAMAYRVGVLKGGRREVAVTVDRPISAATDLVPSTSVQASIPGTEPVLIAERA